MDSIFFKCACCGEDKWIYIDENGTRHLVMQSWYDFDNSIVYLGNIITR